MIFSFICLWTSCQANMSGLFCTLWVIGFGSWVSAHCPAFPMASTCPPRNWLSPHWFMDAASVTRPMAFNALAYDFETQSLHHLTVQTQCALRNQQMFVQTRYFEIPIGLSTNPHLRSLTSSKNHFFNWLTTHRETSDAASTSPALKTNVAPPPLITDKNSWEHNDSFSAPNLERTTWLSSQHDSFCCRALHKGLP